MLPQWLQLSLLLVLAVLAVALLTRSAFVLRSRELPRRAIAALLLLRAGTLLALLLAVANAGWLQASRLLQRPVLVVLQDTSASMSLGSGGGETRAREASRLLAELTAQGLLAPFRVIRLGFSAGLQPASTVEAPPAGDTSNLAGALSAAVRRYRPDSVLLISDGAETLGEGCGAAAAARRAGVHVFTAGAGSLAPPADLGPLTLVAPRVVKESQPFDVAVGLGGTGYRGPQSLEIIRDGTALARPRLTLAAAAGAEARLHYQAPGMPAGYHLLTVRATPRPGEVTRANNERTVLVEARRDRTRFLIVAGAPSPEYAALKRELRGLPKMDFDWHVRTARNTYSHDLPEAPRREALNLSRLLDKRHVLVLVNLEPAAVEAAAVRAFVAGGGALAVLGGPRALAGGAGGLSGLLPVRATGSGYSATPLPVASPEPATPLGRELLLGAPAAVWRAAPFLSGANTVSAAGPGATTVLRTRSGGPLLVTSALPTARALFLGSDGTFRWVLSPQADDGSRRLHSLLWQTLVSWLAQPRDDRQVLLMLDPPVAPAGLPVRVLVQVSRALQPVNDAAVTVRVQGPGTNRKLTARLTATPGRYQVALGETPGTYTVSAEATLGALLGRAERKLVVEPGGAEFVRLTLQEGALKGIAAAGGGEYRPVTRLAELLGRVPGEARAVPTRRHTRPWRSWPPVALMVVLCSVEWALRRRWGA